MKRQHKKIPTLSRNLRASCLRQSTVYIATELLPEMLPTVPKWSARMPHRLAHSMRLLMSMFKWATWHKERQTDRQTEERKVVVRRWTASQNIA